MSSKTTGSVVDVLDRVIGLAPSSSNQQQPQFIASKKFQGAKSGYVFRTSEQYGTGYHLDQSISTTTTNGDNGGAAPDGGGNDKKRARFDASHNTTHTIPSRPIKQQSKTKLTGDELLAQAESQQSEAPTKLLELTPRGIQAASQSLNKTYQRNSLLRAQHFNNPSKFMFNEIALNDEITSFKSAAVNVTMYNKLVEYGVMDSFVGLMSHDNSDVVISVVNVLVELFDPDVLLVQQQLQQQEDDKDNNNNTAEEREHNMRKLVNSFVNGGGLDLLSSNLGRFDESIEEDAKGIEDVLTLVESILDLERSGVLQRDVVQSDDQEREEDDDNNNNNKSSMSIVACICQQTTLLSWLFQRIDKSDNDSSNNEATATSTASAPISPAVLKLHASEVLSTILQHEDYSTSRCGSRLAMLPKYTSAFDDDDDDDEDSAKPKDGEQEIEDTIIDGMEVLLLAIAAYRKSDPQVEVECEFLENVFDALAASLLREDNVRDFVKAEGIELMLRCIRQKVHAGGGALKVLNFALSGSAARREDGDDDNSNSDNAYRQACETFVHAGGLKLLFPLYMARKSAIPCPATCSEGGSKLAKKKDNKNGDGAAVLSKRAKRAAHARKKWLVEVEQNAINIMYALTRHIVKESKYDAHARLLVKFVEEDCEKCDRTIELCLKYDEKARIAEYQYFRSDDAEEAERLGIDVEFAALAAKLRGGGDVFHRSCAILSFAIVGSKRCRGHVMDQLKLQGSGMSGEFFYSNVLRTVSIIASC